MFKELSEEREAVEKSVVRSRVEASEQDVASPRSDVVDFAFRKQVPRNDGGSESSEEGYEGIGERIRRHSSSRQRSVLVESSSNLVHLFGNARTKEEVGRAHVDGVNHVPELFGNWERRWLLGARIRRRRRRFLGASAELF